MSFVYVFYFVYFGLST